MRLKLRASGAVVIGETVFVEMFGHAFHRGVLALGVRCGRAEFLRPRQRVGEGFDERVLGFALAACGPD